MRLLLQIMLVMLGSLAMIMLAVMMVLYVERPAMQILDALL